MDRRHYLNYLQINLMGFRTFEIFLLCPLFNTLFCHLVLLGSRVFLVKSCPNFTVGVGILAGIQPLPLRVNQCPLFFSLSNKSTNSFPCKSICWILAAIAIENRSGRWSGLGCDHLHLAREIERNSVLFHSFLYKGFSFDQLIDVCICSGLGWIWSSWTTEKERIKSVH